MHNYTRLTNKQHWWFLIQNAGTVQCNTPRANLTGHSLQGQILINKKHLWFLLRSEAIHTCRLVSVTMGHTLDSLSNEWCQLHETVRKT